MTFEINQWWGYKHLNGSIQVKIYWGEKDIEEARESRFCEKVLGPFTARSREEALLKLEQRLSKKKRPPEKSTHTC